MSNLSRSAQVSKITRRQALAVAPLALLPVAPQKHQTADGDALASQAIAAVKAFRDARRNLRAVRQQLAGAGPVGDTRLEMAESLAGIAASNAEQVLVAAILVAAGHIVDLADLEDGYGSYDPLPGSLTHDGRRYELVGVPARVRVVRLDRLADASA